MMAENGFTGCIPSLFRKYQLFGIFRFIQQSIVHSKTRTPNNNNVSQAVKQQFGWANTDLDVQLSARHRLAVQLQSIKPRVKAISERRNAFSLNRIDMPSTSSATVEKWHDPRLAALYLDEADVVGIENPKHLLVSWLVEGEEKLSSISVVGMAGMGKTTLVKKVCDSHPIRRSFDTHSWVTVSKSFASTELLRVALQGFLVTANEPVPDNLQSLTDFQLIDAIYGL
jgi:disease resistance protein RPM1